MRQITTHSEEVVSKPVFKRCDWCKREIVGASVICKEWTDWEDFERKYGSTGDPEAAARRFSLFGKLDNIGWLLKNSLIDPEWVHSQFHLNVSILWLKFEPYILQARKALRTPTYYIGFEYLRSEEHTSELQSR